MFTGGVRYYGSEQGWLHRQERPEGSLRLDGCVCLSVFPCALTVSINPTGQIADDRKLDDMLKETGESRINFTMFLTLFGEKLTGNSFSLAYT